MTTPELKEARSGRSFFGHPGGLAVLFGTELWERFSFYGLSSILVLFLMADVAHDGLGMSETLSVAIASIYSGLVYLTSLPGGWLADRVLGARRAVFVGGVIIMLGHISMALPLGGAAPVFIGLALIVIGSGFLKPNISTLVGRLYDGQSDARRDAGFSVFYMGINLGSFLGQLVVPYLAGEAGWHWGFGAAAVGMAVGLVMYRMGWKSVGGADEGQDPDKPANPLSPVEARRVLNATLITTAALVLVFTAWGFLLPFKSSYIPFIIAVAEIAIALIYFVKIFRQAGGMTAQESSRMKGFIGLFAASAVFWMLYFQIFSGVLVFIEDSVDRDVLGFLVPSGWVNNISTVFILLFAPLFAALWVKLGEGFSAVKKFTAALFLIGVPFLMLGWLKGSADVTGDKVGLSWMILVFLLIVFGELSISPVGMSVTQQLAPKRIRSEMMGLWFLSLALGSPLGGLLYTAMVPAFGQVGFFYALGGLALVAGVVMLFFTKPLDKMIK
ncbi:peptide MFS transporter [Salininema proteolyticum]|uniref:Peptide MFS transporter n=1 Tax=Salininema proteolyticum TaxID=1607685 RepID=A0ABV8TSV6_9ACTN